MVHLYQCGVNLIPLLTVIAAKVHLDTSKHKEVQDFINTFYLANLTIPVDPLILLN